MSLKGYLENKPELRHEAIQNDIADNVARDARALFHHPELVKLSKALGDRHKRYVLFVRAIASIIGRVHIESQKIRASLAFQLTNPDNGLPKIITFEPLWNKSFTITIPTFATQMLTKHVVSPLTAAQWHSCWFYISGF